MSFFSSATSPVSPRPWLHIPLPAILLGIAIWTGYYTRDHFTLDMELVVYGSVLGPLAFGVSAALLAVSYPKERRSRIVTIHFIVVLASGILAFSVGPSLGRRCWDHWILEPRREALLEFSRHPPDQDQCPIVISGYPFERYEKSPQGVLLYIQLVGGPWPSFGVFVPYSETYRGFTPPTQGEPEAARSVTPTSVDHLFWFVSRR